MRSLWFAGQDLDRKPPRVCRGRAHPGWPQQKVLLTMLWAAPSPPATGAGSPYRRRVLLAAPPPAALL